MSRPALAERLGAAARVTVVSAPPGSGKTVLLRSWVGNAGLADRTAWVSVEAVELRRVEPDEVTALHQVAARWFAEHGYPVEAIRHAQAAQDCRAGVGPGRHRSPGLAELAG